MSRIRWIRRYVVPALASGGVLAGYLAAQSGTADNSQVGARIVAEGTERGAVACSRCHGFDGLSDGSGAFPVLAGQPAYYLSEQLQKYASGERRNAIMESIAKGLTAQEKESVAQYYANVTTPSIPRRPGSPELVARGKQLALVGDPVARVQNCVGCHGPKGAGEPPTNPYLEGQYKHYIKLQMEMLRKGYWKVGQMTRVAHGLTDQDVEAVAVYFDQRPRPSSK
jgi:cytochrome c553